MKYIICLVLCLIAGLSLYAEESGLKDGAVLWGENCMGCHIPQNFLAAEFHEEYVQELVEEIDYNIFDPESGMNFLSFLTGDEKKRIARFLLTGSHGESWMAGGHSWQAEEFGTGTCYKCHDNPQLYKEPPVSCNSCHS